MRPVYVLLAAFAVAGCGGGPPTIAGLYNLDDSARDKALRPIPLRVVVARLDDRRAEEEKTGEGKGKGFVATRDESFKDILGQLAEAMVKHFREVQLFADARTASYSSSQLTGEGLAALRDKADAVLVGSLEHFYGIVYRSAAQQQAMLQAAVFGGPIGAVLMFGVESSIRKDVEGHAALSDIKLVDVKSGATLWQGGVEGQFRRPENGLPDSKELAVEALKQAVTSLVEKLRAMDAAAVTISTGAKTAGVEEAKP